MSDDLSAEATTADPAPMTARERAEQAADIHMRAFMWHDRHKLADDIERQITEHTAALTAALDECRQILDRYGIGLPCSFDGGKTFRPFSLPDRVEMACLAATDTEQPAP